MNIQQPAGVMAHERGPAHPHEACQYHQMRFEAVKIVGKRRFDPGPFEVTWSFDGGASQSREFETRVPTFFPTGIAIQGIVDIDTAGEASFRNEQYTPL